MGKYCKVFKLVFMGLNFCGLWIFTTLAVFMSTILAWITNIILHMYSIYLY